MYKENGYKGEDRMVIPRKVQKIIKQLELKGHEAYVVGGCVRDSLIGKKPKDWDITTNANVNQIKKCMGWATIIQKGNSERYGTVVVMVEGEEFEITTYRTDGKYTDGRHPDKVGFTNSLEMDLARRDFTINAMAYNHKKGLIDPFGGKEDLKNKTLRCVGSTARLSEDYLRVLRAVRFSVKYGLKMEKKTAEEVNRMLPEVRLKVTAERVRNELTQIIVNADKDTPLLRMTLMGVIPELVKCNKFEQYNPYHKYDVLTHMIVAMLSTEKEEVIRYSALLHDIAKPYTFSREEDGTGHFYGHAKKSAEMADSILERLRVPNETKMKIVRLIELHDGVTIPDKKIIRRAMMKVFDYDMLLDIKVADAKGKEDSRRDAQLEEIKKVRALYKEIMREEGIMSRKQLAVNGNDVMRILNIPPSQYVKVVLNKCLSRVLEEPSRNNKVYLEKYIRELGREGVRK